MTDERAKKILSGLDDNKYIIRAKFIRSDVKNKKDIKDELNKRA